VNLSFDKFVGDLYVRNEN